MKGNFQTGIGFKLPTGAYKSSDNFYNVAPEGSTQVRLVDHSIQPVDGGFGVITKLNGYFKFFTKIQFIRESLLSD